MKILILFASLTGNTGRIAAAITEEMTKNHDVRCIQIASMAEDFSKEITNSDLVGLGYWVDKGTANKEILSLKERLSGKKCFFFGTIGAQTDSEHARQCVQKVESHFSESHNLGHFLCRGKIDPKITEMLKNLPEGHAHSMTEERLKRHEEAAKHPNEEDIENARRFANEVVKKI